MVLGERISELVKYSKMSIPRFSDYAGFKTPQAVRELIKGNTKTLSDSAIHKITSTFPELNIQWLLTGEGEMLKDIRVEDAPADELVPLIPEAAIAGRYTDYFNEGVDLSMCDRVRSPFPSAEIAINVSGDSMEPEIPNGCRIFARRINDTAFIAWGCPYLINTENGSFIKKLYPCDDLEYVEARSSNPAYPPFQIPVTSIYGVYRILGITRIFMTM